MLHIPKQSLELQRVVVNSMSRYTFAVIQPSHFGVENQEIATGVGVKWKEAYLILTAGHVVEHCPENTLRFFLPASEIQFAPAGGTGLTKSVELRWLQELADPKPPLFADDDDLAAILLPQQTGADQHFFHLQEDSLVPADGTEVGVFGYPKAAKLPMEENYVATAAHFFGKFNSSNSACKHDPIQDFTLPYELPHRAKGFSGSGLWYWSSTPLWSPAALLIGIVTTECTIDHIVGGYAVQTIIRFLNDAFS